MEEPAPSESTNDRPAAALPFGELDEVEARILGCLMEKQKTTPDYYPMTLNGLTSACNQKSSRHPVMELMEKSVDTGLERLREKRLAAMVSTAGGHVPKFRHTLDNHLGLSPAEHALLCVLLLRGPQTVGELRGRTERLHKFGALEEVQATLDGMAHHQHASLVARLPREPGRKDHRFAHLLGGEVERAEPTPSAPAPSSPPPEESASLRDEVAALRKELEALRAEFDALRTTLGDAPPPDNPPMQR